MCYPTLFLTCYKVLLLTLVISVAGNIAYSLGPLLEAVPALYLVLVSRFVVGVGAGNVVILCHRGS